MKRSICRKCLRPIIWALNDITGNPAPIDPDPVPDGNIALHEAEAGVIYSIVPAQGRVAPLHLNHFATCPNAAYFKREPRQGGDAA